MNAEDGRGAPAGSQETAYHGGGVGSTRPRILLVAAAAIDGGAVERALVHALARHAPTSPPVMSAATLSEALTIVKSDAIDVAVSCEASVHTALDTLAVLGRADPDIPILVVRTATDPDLTAGLLRAGAHDVLGLDEVPPSAVARILLAVQEQQRWRRASAERVKELQLVIDVTTILNDPAIDLETVLARVAARLPAGFARPSRASARVVVERGVMRHVATTPGFAQTTHHLSRARRFADDARAELTVGYPAQPTSGPMASVFLPEEEQMLALAASILCDHLARRLADAEAERVRRELERRHAVLQRQLQVHAHYLEGASTDEVAASVLEAAIATVRRAELGSVLLRTDEGDFRFAAAQGYDPRVIEAIRIPADQVLFDRDWRDGRAFVVRDVAYVNAAIERSRPNLAALAHATRDSRVRESLVAPVVSAGTLVAAVCVEHTLPGDHFDDADGALLQVFAQGLAPVLERSAAEARAAVMTLAADTTSDGIAIVDVTTDFQRIGVWHANRAFLALLGLPRPQLSKRVLERALGCSTARRVAVAARRTMVDGEPTRIDVSLRGNDRERHVEASLARVHGDEHGARLVITVRDVSERVRYTTELERLNATLAVRLDETRCLEAIDTAIAASSEPSETLAGVLEQVAQRPGLAAVNLLVVDDVSGELRHAAADEAAIAAGLHGRSLGVDDPAVRLRAEARRDAVSTRELPPLLHPTGRSVDGNDPPGAVGRYVAWPLIVQDSTIGVLETLLAPDFEPDPAWWRFMGVVAGQTAIAVEHAAMLQRLRAAAQAYANLASFSGAIEDVDDPDDLVDLGVRTLLQEFGMDRAAYFDRTPDAMLTARRRWGEIDDAARPIVEAPQPVGRGAIGIAAATGEATHVAEYASWPHAEPRLVPLGFRSILALPVHRDEQVSGVIGLGAYGRTVRLRDDQITIARAFVRRLERALERVADRQQIERTREDAFRALGIALEHRDYETKGHTDRVVALARRLGERVGLAADDLEALVWGAYLHDLGKMAIPDHILLKPGRLTSEEFEHVKRHAVVGFDMSQDLAFLPPATRSVIRSHHERWDGTGYPDGLAGADIPYLARLFALVDVYDALTSERPYKAAWSHQEAAAELAAQAGTQFDPDLVAVMLALLSEDARAR